MQVLIVIHGIGTHAAGEVLDAVRATVAGDPERDVREFNWSRIPGVVSGPTLSFDTIQRMNEGFAAAARLGVARHRAAVAAEALFGLAMSVPVLSPLLTGMLVAVSGDLWSAIRLQLAVMATLLALAGGAALVVLARLVGAAVGQRDAAPLAEWLRWLTLLAVRPLVLVCLLPFAPFLWEFLTWGGNVATVFTWLAATGAFLLAFGWLWGEPWAVMGNVAVAALVVVGVCIAWFAGQLVFAIIGPTLKALLDVFRYVGDQQHRAALRAAFDRLIADLPADDGGVRRATIYAHSLGSVIALDSLLCSRAWTTADDVTLVTCGSPLRRLVMRFFPGAIFPRHVAAVAAQVAPRLRSFRWVNFYRTFDYVGGSLQLTRLGIGRDIRSRSLRKAHSNYFGDPELWTTTAAALETTHPVPVGHMARVTGEGGSPIDTSLPPLLLRVADLVKRSGYILAPAAAVLFVAATVARGGRFGADPADAVRASLARASQTAPATITHWRVSQPGEPPDEIDHFRFEWPGSPPREISVMQGESVFSGYQTLFDVGRLRDAVRANCDLLQARAPLQRPVRIPCRTRQAIEVRYAPDHPDRFDLPAFPPRVSAVRRGFEWFRLLWVGIGWCLVGGALVTWLAGRWLRLLFGVATTTARPGRGAHHCP